MIKPRIHIVIKSPSGGVWNTAKETASAWVGAGYDVSMASVLSADIPAIDGVQTLPILKSQPRNRLVKLWYALSGIVKYLNSEKPNFLVVYSLPLSVLFAALKIFYGYKLNIVTDMHASNHLAHARGMRRSFVFKIVSCVTHNKLIYKWVMKRANAIIAHNAHMVDDLIQNFGLDENRAHNIPAFIDDEFFKTGLPASRSHDTILYVGRMTDQKNIEDLIKSFEILSVKNPNIILNIAGDGPLENKYKAMTVNPNIHFLGARSDIMDLQSQSNCIVLCSHYEGVSLVMMEGAANGVPIIAYDGLSGPHDFITNGENGFLVPHYDVQALASAMEKSLSHSWVPNHIRDMADVFHPGSARQRYYDFVQSQHLASRR
jgi:glycosyltransferase involved in cell wall biosynthesis